MTSTEAAISKKLVQRGQELFDAPKKFIPFTQDKNADTLLNDLDTHPHAFVLACVMDQQVKAERAWLIPYKISQLLDSFEMKDLVDLDESRIVAMMTTPEKLHRFIDKMGHYFHSAVQRIAHHYGGDAAQIWSGNRPSAEVVFRFLEFEGIGPKIGSMAANILAREMKVPMSDYSSIDISVDIHVRRVFHRLGLCHAGASVAQITYKARALHPQFPGLMDLPCWEIGRQWCKSKQPLCEKCYMSSLCASAIGAELS